VRHITIILILFALPLYAEDSDGPTPEETLLLEFTNRFRVDPPADAQRIVDYIKASDKWLLENVDLEMFLKEMKDAKPVPPLVFNRELIDAARGHCRYMIQNELTHGQDDKKPGFTGKNFAERCKAAKYAGFPRAENVYRDALGAWDGHVGFIIDHGEGPGGMQKDRGHRKILLMWDLKEVGVGVVAHRENKASITQVFGERQQVARRAGGVVYVDLNGNGFYDIGEGVGGVKISASTGDSTLTWPSGAYALDLKSDQAVALSAEFGGKVFSRDEKSGRGNSKFDWPLPAESVSALADQLLKKVEAAAAGSVERGAAIVELYLGAKTLPVDEARRAKISEQVKSLKADLERYHKAIMDALETPDAAEFEKLVAEHRKPYAKSALDDWFSQALKVNGACRSLQELERLAKARRLSERDKRALLGDVESTLRRVTVQEFRDYIDKRMARLSE